MDNIHEICNLEDLLLLSSVYTDLIVLQAEANDKGVWSFPQKAQDRRRQIKLRIIAINNDNIRLVLLDAFNDRVNICIPSNNRDLRLLGQQGFNTFAKQGLLR
ncbi:MAG: hypothetical protein MUO76_05925 [Anaerolineaceae bacterium]|nr:hypothetical protein [Anaerolineaceae bacterium]